MHAPIVFVSSTSEDLKPHRTATCEAADRCDFLVRKMECFTAGANPPLDECLAKVDQADLLVLIVAHRFGWVPDGQRVRKDNRKSITWLECERAIEAGKDVLAFLVDEAYNWPLELREEYRLAEAALAGQLTAELATDIQWRVQRLQAFKRKLCDQRIIAKFTTPDTLQLQIVEALREWRKRHPEFAVATPTPTGAEASCDPTSYLKALDEDTAYINIRGIQIRSGQANRFPIDELYIPLTTSFEVAHFRRMGLPTRPFPMSLRSGRRPNLQETPRKADPKATPGPDREQADFEGRHVQLDEALQSPRLVIIGDPGSGKSTFLNRIAHRLCRAQLDPAAADLPQQTLGLAGQPFPVLVRIAELVDHIQTHRGRNAGPANSDAPDWLLHYLAHQCLENRQGLTERFLKQQLEDGNTLVLLDGLDEAPSESLRENVSQLIRRATRAFARCGFVVTSRPAAYHDDVVLAEFDQVDIDRLDDAAIETFLRRWYAALFPDSPRQAAEHGDQVLQALRERIEIRLLARNPVMLTALGVVHWNERRLPEQRADLYDSIIRWLSLSRKQRPGRPAPETTVNLLQELALAMQLHPEGRQVQSNRHGAAQILAPEHRDRSEDSPIVWAERFLEQEELDSGVIVRRGDDVRFWHLTFQEFLAARAIAARDDAQQRQILSMTAAGGTLRIYESEWREMVLLLAGVLYHHGDRRVDRLFAMVLDQLPADASLEDRARCVALLGAAVQDLAPVKYKPGDARYQALLDEVFGLFDRERAGRVPMRVAIQAAEALGQAGDPRLTAAQRVKNWIAIPAGEFQMGSQKRNRRESNYDAEMDDREGPVHAVWLDEFHIAKYPVTVAEFAKFVEQGGYRDQRCWAAGEFGRWPSPNGWDEQLQHPNRPVVNVSWFEAAAFATWSGCRLPTEAEWERAARGTAGRRWPWGPEDPDETRMNYRPGKDWSEKPNIGCPTPVGIYPRGATSEGICDLAGNVLEWCADWYDEKYYHESPAKNPNCQNAGSFRVLRGGSWSSYARLCRPAYRLDGDPGRHLHLVGLRLVRGCVGCFPVVLE
ncbi:MAG: SUMF1/EgtB/PvdO family nonheme iron enzyme [Planctomycetota bacterium]|nr:SUMF1/EgtB/PvdO family nonheme iron enzyme [Planctomycetota bacterium]